MRPQEIEEHFRELRAAVQSGTISDDEFEAQLKEFLFQDDSGAYWTIGAQTEKWYQYEDGDWVQASPQSTLERVEETAPGPDIESRETPTPPGRHLDKRVVLGLASLLLFACVVMVAVVSYQFGRFSGISAPALESATPTTDLAQSPVPEPTATSTPRGTTPLPPGEATPSPQVTEPPEPPTSTPRPTSTPQPTPTATAAVSPAPAIKYGAPVLVGPEDGALFGPGYQAQLEWRPVEGLREGEYYHVEACWNECETPEEFHGHYTREAKYQFPGWIYRDRAIDEKYYWHVTVRAQQGDQPAGPGDPAISEESQTWVFLLIE